MGDRYSSFLFMFQAALTSIGAHFDYRQHLNAIAGVMDANVKTFIQQGNLPIQEMVAQYIEFRYYGKAKPFWFVLSSEGPVEER